MPQRRWNHLLVALCLLTLAATHWGPMATLPLVVACGATLIVVMAARVTSDTWLRRVALVNFAVGIGVGIGLYAISRLPGVSSSAWVTKPGFWAFSGDAVFYHQTGCQIADSLRHQIPFPKLDLWDHQLTYGSNFHVLVGLLYWLLGEHPLLVVFGNVTLASLTVVMTYRIVSSLSTRRAARIAAGCMVCWPSMLLWSSQVMRDILTSYLMVVAIALVLPLLTSGRLKHASRYCAALFIAVFALYFFREYLAIGVGLAAIGAVALLVLRGSLRGRALGRAVLAITVIGASILSVQRIGPGFFIKLLNPKPMAMHFFEMGVVCEARGEQDKALEAYRQALTLKDDFAPAYLNAGLLLARQGKRVEARHHLSRFLTLYPHDFSAEALRQVIGFLSETSGPSAPVLATAPPPEQEPSQRMADVLAVPGSRADKSSLLSANETALSLPAPRTQPTPAPRPEPTISVPTVPAAGEALPPIQGEHNILVVWKHEHGADITVTLDPANAALQINGGDGQGWASGYIQPPVNISSYRYVNILVKNVSRQPNGVYIELKNEGTQLLGDKQRITLPADNGWHVVQVAIHAGITQTLNYFAVSNPQGPFELGAITFTNDQVSPSPATPQALEYARGLDLMSSSFNPLMGRWMVESFLPEENASVVKSRFVTSQLSVETMGALRRGFVNTGGGSLLTTTIPSNKPRWHDFLSWIPSAFAAVLFSPYPWDWRDVNGRLILFRCFGGLESFAVLLLLPAACVGGWWLMRSKHTAGSLLVWLFLILAIGIGTTVVNAGTLFRLRFSVLVPFLWMVGIGLDRWFQHGTRPWPMRSQKHGSEPAPAPQVVSGVPQEQPLNVR